MILTVTPNPTIDRVLFVRNFAMQDVVRAGREVISPSGKGIDVSLILQQLGLPTQAVALNAGRHGRLLAELLAEHNLAVAWIPALGETRMATLLTDEAVGRQSTILAHTLQATAEHLFKILHWIEQQAASAWGLVSAGSLPPGLPIESHAQILDQAHTHGLITLLDSSGAALQAGVQAVPHILKVNAQEFAALQAAIGQDDLADHTASEYTALDTAEYTADIVAGAADTYDGALRLAERAQAHLGEWAHDAIVITLGREGILAVTVEGVYYAPALPVPVVSPAGAGDAVSAALMAARRRGDDWESALLLASAAAAAVVGNAGTAECTYDQVLALAEEATIIELDPA